MLNKSNKHIRKLRFKS